MVSRGWADSDMRWLLLRDLWGNQVDLGLWAADEGFEHLHDSQSARLSHLLVNDLTAVIPNIASICKGVQPLSCPATAAAFTTACQPIAAKSQPIEVIY